jgi:predicted metal-dependent phosphoesterase TrpH
MRVRYPFAVLLSALAIGTAADRPAQAVARTIGGYRVLAADFHVHVFPFGWSPLSVRETLLEAAHEGLDAVVITPHVQTWQADIALWLAPRMSRSPIVIKGEEVTTPKFHVLAIDVDRTISDRLSLSDTIDAIHRQGGIAIAAHPYRVAWHNYDAASLRKLDGSEVVRPEAQDRESLAAELREFHAKAPLTAFGDSDYHGMGRIGSSRTYVFAAERSARGVMDAVRAGRTVVYDRDRAYGDPALIALAERSGGLPRAVPEWPISNWMTELSRVGAVGALAALVLFNRWNNVAG